ncbi:N-6 DNA methylase [Paenibacillus sp. Soil724D2]|uniref:N-6 DNA methylase n=1 Tax=Paenibacillus sp. (strain Soil724D2) TaxID=1736392 RepID=UPI000712843A|nr:N-6 DNA methylase [Paenibacillus sp. Soil724D2]KRE48372.1 hypothetical protein ASG85_05055 [Paenibacillus sp. Soil724D2]
MRFPITNNADKDLWTVFDILRGMGDSTAVRNFVFSTAALKFLSENPELGFQVPPEAHWNQVMKHGIDFGRTLSRAFQALEFENTSLQGVFEVYDFSKVIDHVSLFKAAEYLDRYSFALKDQNDPDPLSGTVALFAERLFALAIDREGVRGGEVSSPPGISRLLPQLVDVTRGTVYDGVSGINDFLVELYRYAKSKGGNLRLFGQEIHHETWSLGIINLIFHGLYPHDADVQRGNTITDPAWLENGSLMQFDAIAMNPPFGLSNWGYEVAEKDVYGRFRYGLPSRSHGDMAFVLHTLASLREEGKAAIVVPHGVLFRGAADAKIRGELIKANMIEAVIALPGNLFVGTGIPVAILILNKKKDDSLRNQVFFIKADEGFEKISRSRNDLRESDIVKIVDVYRNKKVEENYSKFVNIEELAENEWSLTPLRYFERIEVSTKFGTVEIDRSQYERLEIQRVRLSEVAEITRGFVPPKETEGEDASHLLVNLSNVQDGRIVPEELAGIKLDLKKAKQYELESGDILLSSRGTSIKIVTVPDDLVIYDKPLAFSQNFLRIRVLSQRVDPLYVKAFLDSPLGQFYLEALQTGTINVSLSNKDVGNIEIPLLPLDDQRSIGKAIQDADLEQEETITAATKRRNEAYLETYSKMGIAGTFRIVD